MMYYMLHNLGSKLEGLELMPFEPFVRISSSEAPSMTCNFLSSIYKQQIQEEKDSKFQ